MLQAMSTCNSLAYGYEIAAAELTWWLTSKFRHGISSAKYYPGIVVRELPSLLNWLVTKYGERQ